MYFLTGIVHTNQLFLPCMHVIVHCELCLYWNLAFWSCKTFYQFYAQVLLYIWIWIKITFLSMSAHYMNIAIYFFKKLTLFRYFNSIPLLQTLQSYGIYGFGTIMVNRKGFPTQLKNPHLANRGDAEQMQHNNLVATVWNDAKPVCLHGLILTFHFIEHLQFSYTVKTLCCLFS